MSGSDEHRCTGRLEGVGDVHVHGVTCREISEFLLSYLERELDPDARAEFERHLQLCPPCHHYLDGYRATVELVRRCVRDAGAEAEQAGDGSTCATKPASYQKPPEHLIQAILAAKRSLDP